MLTLLLRTCILYVFLNVIMRFMGKRQIGELEVSEMITTLMLSELIFVPIGDTEVPLMNCIVPIMFIFFCELFLSTFKNRSLKLKSVLEGRPRYIIYKGRLLQKALRDNRISLNEFLGALRTGGVFSIATVEYAILEANGTVSILQKEEDAPLSSGMFLKEGLKKEGQPQPRASMAHTLIIDGEVMKDTLRLLGLETHWLSARLKERHLKLCEVFLFTLDENMECYVIKKERDEKT